MNNINQELGITPHIRKQSIESQPMAHKIIESNPDVADPEDITFSPIDQQNRA